MSDNGLNSTEQFANFLEAMVTKKVSTPQTPTSQLPQQQGNQFISQPVPSPSNIQRQLNVQNIQRHTHLGQQTNLMQQTRSQQMYLAKLKSALPPVEYQRLVALSTQLQTGKISKPEFDKQYQQLIARVKQPQLYTQPKIQTTTGIPVNGIGRGVIMAPTGGFTMGPQGIVSTAGRGFQQMLGVQANTMIPRQFQRPVAQPTPQITQDMKQKLVEYFKATKEVKQTILEQNPQLVPIVRHILEQRKQQMQQAPVQHISRPMVTTPSTISVQQQQQMALQTSARLKRPRTPKVKEEPMKKPKIIAKPPITPAGAPVTIMPSGVQISKMIPGGIPILPTTPVVAEKRREPDMMKDVCAAIDLEQEQELLLEDDMDELSPPPTVYPYMRVQILNLGPLRNKVQRKAKEKGIKHVNEAVYEFISNAVEERLRDIISELVLNAAHRRDPLRSKRGLITITSTIGQRLLQIDKAKKEQLEAERLQRETEKQESESRAEIASLANASKKGPKKDASKKKQKDKKKLEEEDRLRTTSMNVAAEMAIGNITFRGTGRKISMQRTEIRQQQSRQTPQHANGRGKPQLPPPPPVPKTLRISTADILFLLERDPMTRKSRAMYSIYSKLKP